MRVKELAHWIDSFNLQNSPWKDMDWETALNLLARLLYNQLSERVNKDKNEDTSEARESSLQLPFQEVMELAERSLGVPQFVVVCDTKQTVAENQLAIFTTLCSLRFAMAECDTKPFRDIQFSFRLYFDLDVDDSSRFCVSCKQQVALVERLIIDGTVWHRNCLRCAVSSCSKQLCRGLFHMNLANRKMECVEHYANRVLFGDPMRRLSLFDVQTIVEKKSISPSAYANPPPRPPPPRIVGRALASTENSGSVEEDKEDLIAKQIALAANDRHDVPVLELLNKEQTHEKNWEVLDYPEELNPFGSEEGEENDRRSRCSSDSDDNNNPFASDSDLEEVDNPGDRVDSSFGNTSPNQTATDDSSSPPTSTRTEDPNKLIDPPPQKPPRTNGNGHIEKVEEGDSADKLTPIQCLDSDVSDPALKDHYQYFAPLPPMVFRDDSSKKQKQDGRHSFPSTQKGSEQSAHDLEMQLRKLHCQLGQHEIIGRRLETQLLRAITNKDKTVWKKSNKVLEDYARLVERRCEALRMESILMRSYMGMFVNAAHSELEKQMKDCSDMNSRKSKESVEDMQGNTDEQQQQHSNLLAQLLHMKNELTSLEMAKRKSVVPTFTTGSLSPTSTISPHHGASVLKKGVKQTLKTLKKKL